MANKRIPTSALSAVPTQQGQVLKGEHLALLREILSTGVNANKHDIDRIIAGNVDAYIYYDTPTNSGLFYLESLAEVDINTEGFVVSYKDIQYYLYTGSSWEFQASLSLVDLFRKVQVLETAAGFDTSFVDDFTLILQNIQNQINNIESGSIRQDEIYISETAPYQEGLKVWIKPIEEQIQEEPIDMMFMLPELETEEEPPQDELPELVVQSE